ncbi:MAG TPA: maleylpyruvate isomerase family mycothiol-dependent enzyme [Nocardioides sp.]|nr:maleylpyruvate isomerase family mycothiol-dependent enzyme [Nocardioides sp.]
MSLAELIRAERLAFVDLLRTLAPEEWAVRSLCGEWTVQEVAAHLAVAPIAPPGRVLASFVRSGFRINRANAALAKSWAGRGRHAITEQLRTNAERGARPLGVPPVAALVDAVVHGLDVRRPLDRPRRVPPEAFLRVAEFSVALRGPLTVLVGGRPRDRVRGVRLVADDVEWAHGEGPEVHGTPETVLLLLAGRPLTRDDLSGPGASLLHERLVP